MNEMPYEELKNWVNFFSKQPPGWKEDYRTYLIVAAFGYKGKPEDLFPTLAQMKRHKAEFEEATRVLPSGRFLDMMRKAKNGDGSGWKPNWG